MENALQDGYAELVPVEELKLADTSKVNYIPQHGVLKESSTSTRLQIVFDVSILPDTNNSMNFSLMVGPKLQYDRIYCWGFDKIAADADISKMYNKGCGSDESFAIFFLRERGNGDLKEYRHSRQVFGTSSAAHSSTAAVQWNAKKFSGQFPWASTITIQDTYAVHLLTRANREKGA
ncbi:uncharacterized protein [Lepeophtheirus salmonis]|uniref:uncharacterized protein n=1 Tax=Lepeophtheirus salmonis TaxID=72036 RepID=UPI001AEB5237|nr:uncharacterized protein LOC121117616 [Lepeophtheirus salmonis]